METAGFKLDPGIREKWLLPPGKLEKSFFRHSLILGKISAPRVTISP